MDPETTEATETPTTETPAVEAKSFDDRLMEFVEEQVKQDTADGAATDSATDDAAVTETAETTEAAATKETPAPVETKTTAATEPPFTEEQLNDDAFFDKLDAAGWEKLKAFSPALHNMGKQVARLRGKAGAALKGQPQPTEERSEATPPKVSDAMKAAIRKSQSLDEEEAIEGQAEVALLAVREEREREQQAQAEAKKESKAVYDDAYTIAKAELPDLDTIPDKELDEAVESSPKLMRKLEAAGSHPNRDQRVLLIADVMEEAGRLVVAKRQAATKAADETKAATKAADTKARVQSNATNPAQLLADTPGGQQTRKTGKSFEKDGLAFIQDQLKSIAS